MHSRNLLLQIIVLFVVGAFVASYGVGFRSEKENRQKIKETPKASVSFKRLASAKMKNRWHSKSSLSFKNLEKAYPGFTLYPISGPEEIKLLNMNGDVVHKWTGIDVDRARLTPDCTLVALHGSKNRIKDEPWRGLRKRVSEYDWDGKLIWSYTSDHIIHHDLRVLDNGNILTLLKVPVPQEYLNTIEDPIRRQVQVKGDQVIEINKQGEVVWSWNSWEHIDLNDCGVRDCVGTAKAKANGDKVNLDDLKDWTHMNTVSEIPDNKWYQAGDQRFKPGNLILMARNFWTIFIIDRQTGKVVWDYTGDYKGGIIGGHEASMVPMRSPGAGNIIVVDNGNAARNSSSFILEINPQTKKTEWVYDVGPEFHTRARGSVQRLVNGNTLISEDRTGRVFEVTQDKEKVWEYTGNLLSIRAQRYEKNFCEKLEGLPLT